MPSSSEKQRRFMGAELARLRAGKKTKTGMSEKQLGEFAAKVQETPPKNKRPHGSGTFTAQELRRGFKRVGG